MITSQFNCCRSFHFSICIGYTTEYFVSHVRLSPSEVVFTCNDLPHVVGLVVDNIFCGLLVCPLIVDVDIWTCCWLAVAVSPGQ